MKQAHAPDVSPRPSACPGLWRIVSARDGGICRIKLPGGLLLAEQAEAVAAAAERFAGGVIEATNRGNLQIRGIGEQSAALIDSLLAAAMSCTANHHLMLLIFQPLLQVQEALSSMDCLLQKRAATVLAPLVM